MTMHAQFERYRAMVEAALPLALPKDSGWAEVITDAARYSLLAGGKRLRPCLVLAAAERVGTDLRDSPSALREALPAACAMEMIHTYSLIHDDLPAMDDDDMRRGRPSNHAVYGEATAILAGDGLLTAAFGQLARADLPGERIVQAVDCLSRAAGPEGMVAGQALDMAGEGRALVKSELEQLQGLKTGALIRAAAELGCIAAGGTGEQREQIRTYAQALGRAFQVRDDMLDVIGTDGELGKPVGSDRSNEKSTFVTALGLEGCAALVDQLTREAVRAVEPFARPEFLIWLAESLASRRT